MNTLDIPHVKGECLYCKKQGVVGPNEGAYYWISEDEKITQWNTNKIKYVCYDCVLQRYTSGDFYNWCSECGGEFLSSELEYGMCKKCAEAPVTVSRDFLRHIVQVMKNFDVPYYDEVTLKLFTDLDNLIEGKADESK